MIQPHLLLRREVGDEKQTDRKGAQVCSAASSSAASQSAFEAALALNGSADSSDIFFSRLQRAKLRMRLHPLPEAHGEEQFC